MNINIPFDSTQDSLNTIKLCAFYFEKIKVLCYEELVRKDTAVIPYQWYNNDIINHIKKTQDHGIIEVCIIREEHDKLDDYIADVVVKTMREINRVNGSQVPELNKRLIVNDNDLRAYFSIKNPYIENTNRLLQLCEEYEVEVGYTKEHGILAYYYYQLLLLYKVIFSYEHCLSNNQFLNMCIDKIYNNETNLLRIKKRPQELIAINAIPILIPSFSQMSFEDIFELRLKANDELLELRYYINSLSFEYNPDDIKMENIKDILESKIKPSVKQLERKIFNIRVNSFQKLLDELKNPLTYVPLLTSFFTDIPSHITLAASMSIISANVGLDYLKQKKEVESNPLYFSIKMKNRIKKLRSIRNSSISFPL